MKLRLGHHIAALALNRFDDYAGHFVGRYEMDEQLMFEKVEALGLARFRFQADRASIAVAVRGMEGARLHRPEAAALNRLARRQRERAERAAVKAAQKRDHAVALRDVARELDCRFNRFGAGVRKERSLVTAERRQLVERLGEAHLRLVIEIGSRHVQEFLRLIDDGGDDLGMRVAGGIDGNAGGAVEKAVAVDILDDRAGAARHDEWIAARIGRRDDFAVTFDDGFGFGTRKGGLDRRLVHTDDRSAECRVRSSEYLFWTLHS